MAASLRVTVLALLCIALPGRGSDTTIPASSGPISHINGGEECVSHNVKDGLFKPETAHPRVIVTGGAGFIGGHLTQQLVGRLGSGQLKIVDNLQHGDVRNLQTSDGKWVVDITADLCRADLRDSQLTRRILRGADTVIHLADVSGSAGCLREHHQDVFSENILIDSNTIAAAKENGVTSFIYVSADCTPTARQQKRTRESSIAEQSSSTVDHASAYQQSKILGEEQAELAKSDAFHVGILRLRNVYGPGSDRSILPAHHFSTVMMKAPMGASEDLASTAEIQHPQDLIFVSDAVEAILLTLERGLDKGPVVVGGEETLTDSLAEVSHSAVQLLAKCVSLDHVAQCSMSLPFKIMSALNARVIMRSHALLQALIRTSQKAGLQAAPSFSVAGRGTHQANGGSTANLTAVQKVLSWKPSSGLEVGLEATLPAVVRKRQQARTLVILIGQVTFCNF